MYKFHTKRLRIHKNLKLPNKTILEIECFVSFQIPSFNVGFILILIYCNHSFFGFTSFTYFIYL